MHNNTFSQFNGFLGFQDNSEFLPDEFDKFDSKEKLRQLFLYMSNTILKDICNFNKYEQTFLSKYTLKQAFSYKIKKELKISSFFIYS